MQNYFLFISAACRRLCMAYLTMRSVLVYLAATMNSANSLIWEDTWVTEENICFYRIQWRSLQVLSKHFDILLISLKGLLWWKTWPLCARYIVCVCVCKDHVIFPAGIWTQIPFCPPGEAFWLMWLASSCVSHCVRICVPAGKFCACAGTRMWVKNPTYSNYKSHHPLKRIATKLHRLQLSDPLV